MRFTITPLGSAGGRTMGRVVGDIVRYLEPRAVAMSAPSLAPVVPGGTGPSSYYADRGTEPGRWLGVGAREAFLVGAVDPEDFARVLAGRDPRTGRRLISAQGSAGRRPDLGVGNATRTGADGVALYDLRDAAAALGVSRAEAEAMATAGTRVAVAGIVSVMTSGTPTAQPEPPGTYLLPIIEHDGTLWISDAELDRCDQARALGIEPSAVAALGAAEDQLTLTEAARLSGVTARYLRGLSRRWEEHRDEIEATLSEGRTPTKAYLVAYRGIKGQWRIKRADLVDFLERRQAPAVRVGYDLTLTTEKSLGVLGLLGGDHVRRAVLDAIQAGNDAGLRYLEWWATAARSRGKRVHVRGWTVASFRHLTSRALDPFPHHHNVVANTVVDEHGTRRALDARGMYLHAEEASALATAEMRYRLTHALGVRWRPSRSGGWEIDGIPDEVCREFSKRRSEIEDAVAELEEAIGRTSTLDEVQNLVTSTRPPKEEVDAAQLVVGWWERAERLGFTATDLDHCVREPVALATPDQDQIFRMLVDPESGLCARTSIFTRGDVVTTLVDLAIEQPDGPVQPLLIPAADLDRLADEFLASDHVVELFPADLSERSVLTRGPLFSTPEILAIQRRILNSYEAGVGAAPRVPSDALAATLDAHPHLSDEQRNLVASFCASGQAVQCAIGRAGTGKTTAMRAVAEAWETTGWTVLGAAVKGEAARHLAEGAGIAAETVAWYLAHTDPQNPPFDARTILVIDEATTLSDRDLDRLLAMAAHAGTVLRLIGDPAQHGSVTAGGMFRHLCDLHRSRTPCLERSHRVQDPDDRAAAQALRDGKIEKALAHLEAAGHLDVVTNDIDLYLGMLRRWWESRQAGDHHPMVDRRNRTRRELNRLARQLLKANGELGAKELTGSGDRSFAAGDRVIARRADRTLHPGRLSKNYIRNGAVGTVVAVVPGRDAADDRLRVSFDGIGTIDVPRTFFDEHRRPGGRVDVGLDHAYAVTSYAVQGATFRSSTSRIDDRASRAETYVDITRGRAGNYLFLTRTPDSLEGEQLPRVPPPPIEEAVTRRLKGSGPERAALEVDPDASSAEQRRAAELVGRRAGRLARHEPPPAAFEACRPADSAPIHLHRLWHEAIEAAARYRALWSPLTGNAPWSWALGGRAPTDAAAKERRRAAATIAAFVRADANETLATAAGREAHQWEATAAEAIAGGGGWPPEGRDLTELLERVRHYRAACGLPDDEAASDLAGVLGPVPRDRHLAALRRSLALEMQRGARRLDRAMTR